MIDLLKGEIRKEIYLEKYAEPVLKIYNQIINDIQERLIFQAQRYLKDEIDNHNPNEKDLENYPTKIQIKENIEDNDWYPILTRTLYCLTKLYATIDYLTLLLKML